MPILHRNAPYCCVVRTHGVLFLDVVPDLCELAGERTRGVLIQALLGAPPPYNGDKYKLCLLKRQSGEVEDTSLQVRKLTCDFASDFPSETSFPLENHTEESSRARNRRRL